MHELLDTEHLDLQGERPWPQRFKGRIRSELKKYFYNQVSNKGTFKLLYQRRYKATFPSYEEFLNSITNKVVIGAENGADQALERMIEAFEVGLPLPEVYSYTRNLWPLPLPGELTKAFHNEICEDYSKEHILEHIFENHYCGRYRELSMFISSIAQKMVIGVCNGIEHMLAIIYFSFLRKGPLPVERRNPKLLKTW